MTGYQKFIQHTFVRRMTVLASIVLILWLARSIMSTILLTFIFAFLVTRVLNFFRRRWPHVKAWLVVGPLYLLVLLGVLYALIHYVPAIAVQSVKLFDKVQDFYYSKEFAHNQAMQWALKQFSSMNLKEQVQTGVTAVLKYASNIGAVGITLLMSFILSFFFTVEIDEVKKFGRNFIDSPFGWYFADLKYFADKFINTFGVVIEAQILIALVNTVITTITLIFLKMPNIPSLAIMVFLLSMIPVAGAIISVVPLSLIGYTVGGWKNVLTIVIMIIVIHILEAYVLNPKFMSSRTQLPVFFTFVVLLVAEKMFGTWGLIVGIPVFTFILDILGVKKIAEPKSPAPQTPPQTETDKKK